MAKKQLNVKEQHYADTREEAEEIVEEAKEDIYLTSHGIAEKHNKYGQYFLVDLKFNYDTPKEIMESAPSKQENADSEKGVEYSKDEEGNITVIPGQMELSEIENEGEDE